MSGINHLYDIYNKKGEEFIDQLFNTYVTVNEKMDGSAFTFERDKETGKFKFYRRDQRNPITFVDRTLMKYYEKPIQYIESLPPHILEKIPRGHRFGLEYFANTKPVEITYDRIPKNHLLLSYVHEYGDDGKIKKTVQDKKELDDWADLLGIDRAPIIFQGHLTDDQKGKITDFLRTPFEELVQKYKTQSFVRFIISTLNPDLAKTALNDDLDKDVEGIVFRFGDPAKEVEPVLAKMVDPVFTQMARDKSLKQRENKPSDFLGLTLLDVMNFVLEKGINSFSVEGSDEDERYVSFMSDVFVNFLEEYGDKYKGADFEEPEYLKREEFRLNKDLIDDRRVLKFVNEDESFESLFKLMLNSFRKIKSRAGGIITKGMMEQLNLLIREIKDYIQKPRKGKLNESTFLSFLDFKRENSPAVEYLKEEDEESEADENPFYSYKEFITALDTIDTSPKGLVKEKAEEKQLKDVNLLIGRFQPFHNGHLKMAKFMQEKNGLPSVAVVVYPGHNKSGKSPFDENLIQKYMDGVVRDEKEIEDYLIVPRGLIGSAIVKLMDKGYLPQLIGAGGDRMDDYTKQIEYVKKSEIGEQMKDLKLVETPRVTSATQVKQAITDEDFLEVKRLTPKAVSNLYSALKSKIELDKKANESWSFKLIEEVSKEEEIPEQSPVYNPFSYGEMTKAGRQGRATTIANKINNGDLFAMADGTFKELYFVKPEYEQIFIDADLTGMKELAGTTVNKFTFFEDIKGNKYGLGSLLKDKDLGGQGKGAGTRVQDAALDNLKNYVEKLVQDTGGPITVDVNGDKYPDIVTVETQEGHPKADFNMINSKGEPVIFISHKKASHNGASADDFIRWGGFTEYRDDQEVKLFTNKLKEFLQANNLSVMPRSTVFIKEINSEELAKKIVYGENFGGPFGINNITIAIQGASKLDKQQDGTYKLTGEHTYYNGETPAGEYRPILAGKFRSDRSMFGISGLEAIAQTAGVVHRVTNKYELKGDKFVKLIPKK